MIDRQKVCVIVEEWIATRNDFFIVDVKVTPDNTITVEIDNYDKVTIDDCVELSQYLEKNLDRNIEDYELEVGSAGLGQPFKVREQYKKHAGDEVEYLTKEGKKLQGILIASDEKGCTIRIKKKIKPEGSKKKIEVDEELSYLYEEIKYIKYLIRFK